MENDLPRLRKPAKIAQLSEHETAEEDKAQTSSAIGPLYGKWGEAAGASADP